MEDITITSAAYNPLYNTGVFYTTLKDVGGFGLYSVSVSAKWQDPTIAFPDFLLAWGFVRGKDAIPALTETLLAACELIHANLKEKQHAKA